MAVKVTIEGASLEELVVSARTVLAALEMQLGDAEPEDEPVEVPEPEVEEEEPEVGQKQRDQDTLEGVLRHLFRVGRKGRIIGGRYEFKHHRDDPNHIDRAIWSMGYRLIKEGGHLTGNEIAWLDSHPDEFANLAPVYESYEAWLDEEAA